MSKTPILNKKYSFLQNVFYQSIQSLKVSNKTNMEKKNHSSQKEKKNSIKNLLLFKSNVQKNNAFSAAAAAIETKKNLNFFYSLNKSLSEREENQLNQKNTKRKSFFHELKLISVGKKKNLGRKIFSDTIEMKENLAIEDFKFDRVAATNQNFWCTASGAGRSFASTHLLTFNKSFLENQKNVLSTKQIINFFVPKDLLPINRSFLSCAYKKSFFCYWLLPFMGFVTCIPTMINYPSPKFVFSATQLRYEFNKNFLNNLSLTKNSPNKQINQQELDIEGKKIVNQETRMAYKKYKSFFLETNLEKPYDDLLKIKKLRKINLKNKQPFFMDDQLKTAPIENHNSFFLEDNFDALENSYLKLYDFYNKDLEKTLNNPSVAASAASKTFFPGFALQTAMQPHPQVENQSNNMVGQTVDLNQKTGNKNQENFYSFSNVNWAPLQLNEPIDTFYKNRISQIYTVKFINEAALKWVWLNSSFKSSFISEPFFKRETIKKGNMFGELKNDFFDSYKKEEVKESSFAFLKKNALYCFGERLEKNTYSLLNNIQFCIANEKNHNLNKDLVEFQANFRRTQENGSIFGSILSEIKNYEKEKIISCEAATSAASSYTSGISKDSNKKTLSIAKFVLVKTDELKTNNLFLPDENCLNVPSNLKKVFYLLNSFSNTKLIGIKSMTRTETEGEKKLEFNNKEATIKNQKIENENVSFFLEFDQHKYFPKFFFVASDKKAPTLKKKQIRNDFYKNPLLSYQIASSFIDKFIGREAVCPFGLPLKTEIFKQNGKVEKKSSSSCARVNHEALMNLRQKEEFVTSSLNNILSSISLFSNKKIKNDFDFCKLSYFDFVDMKVNQTKPKMNSRVCVENENKSNFYRNRNEFPNLIKNDTNFLEKTIQFLMTKQINIDPKIVDPTSSIKNSLVNTHLHDNVNFLQNSLDEISLGNPTVINKPFFNREDYFGFVTGEKSLEKGLNKLNKDSLYYIIFDSLNNSLNDKVENRFFKKTNKDHFLESAIIFGDTDENSKKIFKKGGLSPFLPSKSLKNVVYSGKKSLFSFLAKNKFLLLNLTSKKQELFINSKNSLDSNSWSQKFDLLVDCAIDLRSKKEYLSNSTIQQNKNLSVLNKFDLNKLFLKNPRFIYPLKIKLTHPILIVNKEISKPKFIPPSCASSYAKAKELLIHGAVHQVSNLNSKGGNDLTKVMVRSAQQNAGYASSYTKLFSTPIILNNLNFPWSPFVKKQQISKEKSFSASCAYNKNLARCEKENNYSGASHFSKYLDFLSTKIKKGLFNPTKVNFKENLKIKDKQNRLILTSNFYSLYLQSRNKTLKIGGLSTLGRSNQKLNFCSTEQKMSPSCATLKKFYKTRNKRKENYQKRGNNDHPNENLRKLNSSDSTLKVWSQKRRNINFTVKQTNLNIMRFSAAALKDRFRWIASYSEGTQKNPHPYVFLLKRKKMNSQMGRLEKIFRSYLSKKRNLENGVAAKQLPAPLVGHHTNNPASKKLKSEKFKSTFENGDNGINESQKKKSSAGFAMTLERRKHLDFFLQRRDLRPKLNKSIYLKRSLKNVGLVALDETLKKNDPNILILKNKKIKLSKKQGVLNNRNVKHQFYNLSPTLFFKNRMVILKTRTKKLSSKEKNLIKPSNWYIKSNNFLKLQTLQDNLLLNKNRFSMWQQLNLGGVKNALKFNDGAAHQPLKNGVSAKQLPATSASLHQKTYFSFLEKRKSDKKKRRKKKQRKETRRRKKRQRFYPRPIWSRFKLYNKFLKIRHLKLSVNKQTSSAAALAIFKKQKVLNIAKKNLTYSDHFKNLFFDWCENVDEGNLIKQKIYRNYKQNWSSFDLDKKNFFNVSKFKKKGELEQNQISQLFRGKVFKNPSGLNDLDSAYFSFFSKKDFYQISRTVLGDLKRTFWKSYWLRSNLNPYLNRVKTYLNEMKNSTKNWQLYLNIQNLNDFIFGRTHSFREIPDQVNFGFLSKPIGYTSSFSNSRKKTYFLKEETNFLNKNLSYNFKDGGYINIKNYLQSCYLSSSSNNWQVAINIAEYQRIIYERIQQMILNIRENLNLNGQIKARSSKIGRERLQTPKPVKDFWIKFGKAITLEIPNNVPINFYGTLSKLRVNWSLNKSNLSSFKMINKRKNVWISQKLREQKKSNKTKKIISQMVHLFTNSLNEKPIFSNSYETRTTNEPLLKSLTEKTFFKKFLLDKPESKKINNVADQTILLSSLNSKSLSSSVATSAARMKFIKKLINLNLENPGNLEKLKNSLIMSEQKLRKKENKLLYLGFFNKKTKKLSLQKNYLRSLKKELQEVPLLKKNNFKATSGAAKQIYLNVRSCSAATNSFNKFTNRGESNNWEIFNPTLTFPGGIPPFKNTLNSFNNHSLLLWTSTFLFHFCAFISFINFAEVRGLIKFYVILFSKIFKSYLDIIFSISYNFYNVLSSVSSLTSINLNAREDLNIESIKGKVSKTFIKSQKTNFLTNFLINASIPSFKFWSAASVAASAASQKRDLEIQQLKQNYLFRSAKEILNKTSFWSNFWLAASAASQKKIHGHSDKKTMINNQRNTIINFNKTIQLATQSKNIQFYSSIPLSLKKPSSAAAAPLATISTISPNSRVFFGVRQSLNLNSSNSLGKEFFKDHFSNRYSWSFYLGQEFIELLNKSESSKSLLSNQIKTYKVKPYFDLLRNLIYFSFLNLIVKIFVAQRTSLNTKKSKTKQIQLNFPNSHLEKDHFLKKESQISTFLDSSKNSNFFKISMLVFLKTTISSSFKGSFSFYTSLIRSLDIFQIILSSIYSFFEKPGELIVDWIAYAFLVEWSSDLTTTIPDVVDSVVMTSFFKMSRIIRPLIISQVFLLSNPLVMSNSLIQRRILHSYQMIIEQFCQPDSDLIVRQKKGRIFWDIWSELLIDVAEDSNINISELTSLKEEQNRLLEKLEFYASQQKIKNLNLLDKTNWSARSQTKELNKTTTQQVPLRSRETSLLRNLKKSLNTFSKSKIHPYLESQLNQKTNRLNPWFGFNFKKPYSLDKKKFMLGIKDQPLSSNKTMFLTRKQIINQTEMTWSANQFLSYQGKDTELFIDLHPPKSFLHIPSIKFSQSVQQPIGTMICQVFSGIFNQQIAKNVLIVGSSGVEKTLLIQALAGETELKIITDNANRYAMIYRGVAIGIKLLKDVFEALSLHTPCVFLLEDIHHIGERRPFLISDDENSKATEFGSEKEEIHEKNQVIYQLSKHFVSHYKKPYKGDFSLLIPTNHFCFNVFLGGSSPRNRSFNVTPASPINLEKIGVDSSQSNILDSFENKKNLQRSSKGNLLSSSLQIQSNQLLAPPATSPFSVLVLKEEKKLKPKQIVKEMPWSGIPGEQLSLISKSNSSIRVKIALLADMALSNVSVKLDMITDFLVIIDSVKGNRGFIVFATTHVPYILDPALRRPGRFDETISLPLIPNLFSRWEILKANFVSATEPSLYSFFPKGLTVDFTTISGIFSPTFGLLKLNDKLANFNNQLPQQILSPSNQILSPKGHRYLTMTYHLATKQEPLINPSKIQQYSNLSKLWSKNIALEKNISNKTNFGRKEEFIKGNPIISNKKKYIKFQALNLQPLKKTKSQTIKQLSTKTFLNLIARTYFYGSRILSYISTEESLKPLISSTSKNFKSQNIQRVKKLTIAPTDLMLFENNIYLSLYASTKTLKQHLTILMAGKIGELFAFSNYPSCASSYAKRITNSQLEQKSSLLSSNSRNINFNGNEGLISLYGIDKTWRAASSLLFSVLSKRYLLNKNLMTPKLLYFSNHSSFQESPSPPASNILLPLKRYENYKRTFNIEQIKNNPKSPIKNLHSTLELHKQQRYVKRLYKLPIREFFRSEIISEKLVGFANSSMTLASIEKSTIKPTSMNWYYRHRILNRHRNYLNTQWWNGQLNEHNRESTFSSDIDWRYTFVESIGDIFIDFPDSEQFYNAKNRRWNLTFGSWNNWFNFNSANQKITLHQIYNQYIFDCFIKTYTSLDQSREILDFYAFTSLNHCILKELKEISIINIFNRFS